MLAPNIFRRSRKESTVTLVVFFVLFCLVITNWARPATRSLRFKAFETHIVSPDDATQLCAAHKFQPAPLAEATDGSPARKRRVYDLFLLDFELDWLDIRLNELYQHVDYFVIVESNRTFTGLPKPLFLREHWPKLERFHRKIIYVAVEDKGNSTLASDDREGMLQDALVYDVFPQITGTEREPLSGDALIFGNIDEIPRPETIKLLRHCDFPDRLTLRSDFYHYSFQWLHRGEQWAHPQATVFRGLESTISPTDLRHGEGGRSEGSLFAPLQRIRQQADLFDAAWHCSSCFRTIREVQMKLQSSNHTPWDTEADLDPRTIVERVRNGVDLFDRRGEVYDEIEGNRDIPGFILKNWQKYRYLLNRDGDDAGFEDAKDLISA